MIPTNYLKLWYPMQRDGNNAAAAINNLTTTNLPITDGKIDKGFTFSSSSTAKSDNLSLSTNQITVCFWFKCSPSIINVLCEYTDNTNINNGLYVDINEFSKGQIILASLGNNGYNLVETNLKAYNDGKWHHFAGVIDRRINNSEQQFIYIDGVPDYSIRSGYGKINTSNFPANHAMYIGSRATTSFKYVGLMDDFQFYTKALSIENIRRIMIGMHPL